MDAKLIFPDTHRLDGFTSSVTSHRGAEADPVIRELLQNSLDAAVREAGLERAEVHFTISRRPLAELPGLREYRSAFSAAAKERRGRAAGLTHDERSAIERIERVLDAREMHVLFCRDNGIGLDADGLRALLSEGNSTKSSVGAGSYGLGHQTAYAASDLRYVLYGGRRGGRDLFSGHAILATHRKGRTRCDADGYWQTEAGLFSLERGHFPTEAPPLLRPQLDQIESSGSVVAIAGFNHFHDDDPASAFDDICRVAAVNFLAAIWSGRMAVHVRDESSGRSQTVERASLEEILQPIAKQQRRRDGLAGWLVGSQAFRALETLRSGRLLDRAVDRSIAVRFRTLDAHAGERSRVQLFRDGMWIANDAPELGTGAFNGVQPFDAVVLLHDADPEDHGECYDLVRNAEGPEHRGLTKYRELAKADKKRLRDMLKLLAERLREEAGALDREKGFTPEGFAVFDTANLRDTSPVRRIRQQPLAGGEGATDPVGGAEQDPVPPAKPGRGGGGPHVRRAPAPGRAVRLRRTIVPIEYAEGVVRRVEAELDLSGEELREREQYELRVFAESGSDESCDLPLPPRWLSIQSVEIDGTRTDAGGALEIALPRGARSLTIELNEDASAAETIELDVVRRRAASEASR